MATSRTQANGVHTAPHHTGRPLLERAYIKGQHDALAGRRMSLMPEWGKSRVLRALYEAAYDAYYMPEYLLGEAA